MIIDTPTNIQDYAARLAAAGVTTVIRYESRLPGAGWKRVQPDEVQAIKDAGLHLGIVYEDGAHPCGHADGVAAAEWALGRQESVSGLPDGAAIYYTGADYDADASAVNDCIAEYFDGINETHARLRPKVLIGDYAGGMVNSVLLATHRIDFRWITCSLGFRGSRAAVAAGQFELWQSRCDTSLLGIDVDYNVARVGAFGQFVPFGGPVAEPSPAEVAVAALSESPPALQHGRGSVYSWFNGKYDWTDPGDEPNSNALGVPDDCQGVSFYGQAPGKWFEVHYPNGFVSVEQQTDVGPSPSTGRKIDISAVAAERAGYSPSSFPTDATFYWRAALPPWQVAGLGPRQQAIKWLQIRQAAA